MIIALLFNTVLFPRIIYASGFGLLLKELGKAAAEKAAELIGEETTKSGVDYFKKLFKEHRKTIFVVDPYRSRDIVDMLRYYLKTDQVIPIPAYWEHLSKSKLVLEKMRKTHPHENNMRLYNLDYLYQRILDSEA